MQPEIVFTVLKKSSGNLGHIVLNRPKALNALSLTMLEQLEATLERWQSDTQIDAVLIEGAGDRAFCAGGDIRAVYHNKDHVLSGQMPYFKIEYHLNEYIYNFKKPYLAILDGIVMGGGVGISIWGSHPIATDRLVFAMPETQIGLFPDVGACYFLTRLPNYIGYYLGLTGNSINAYEALQLGLVKTVISHTSIDVFKQNLNLQQITLPEPIALDNHSDLLNHQDAIAECFSQNSISKIIQSLEDQDTWCQKIATTLKSRSPLSLKVTFELLKQSHTKDFSEVMRMNAHAVNQFLKNDEFFEGIRAAVIDKDRNPKWQNDISEVDTLDVTSFLSVAHTQP